MLRYAAQDDSLACVGRCHEHRPIVQWPSSSVVNLLSRGSHIVMHVINAARSRAAYGVVQSRHITMDMANTYQTNIALLSTLCKQKK